MEGRESTFKADDLEMRETNQSFAVNDWEKLDDNDSAPVDYTVDGKTYSLTNGITGSEVTDLITVSDDDDDGVLDAGEDANLDVMLENVGIEPTTSSTGTLSSSDPMVEIITAQSMYPGIAAGGFGSGGDAPTAAPLRATWCGVAQIRS